jgi:anti-sigma factor RsiW
VTCAEVRELAAELVLGALDGERRGAVVAHLASCADCRAEVEALTRVTDALWLAVPEAEPPAGFETRVLRRTRWSSVGSSRRLLAAAAVLLLVVAGVTYGALRRTAPAAAASGPMLDAARARVGSAVVGRGSRGVPAYVFVTVDAWGESGDYVVEVIRTDGAHVAVAPIRLDGGRGQAGGRLAVPYAEVRAVWVTDAAHTEWCAFRLPR